MYIKVRQIFELFSKGSLMKKVLITMLLLLAFMSACDGGCSRYCSENFPNSHAGRCWSDRSPNEMNHADATAYCKNLGGRLPTISELRTLIQNCPATQTGGTCGVTDSCLSYGSCRDDSCDGCPYDPSGKYSVFGDTGAFWSSSMRSDYTNNACFVYFSLGYVYDRRRDNNLDARCIR